MSWKILPLILSIFIFLSFPVSASAHSGPPFILVNNQPTVSNPVYVGSSFIKVANEAAPKNFLIGERISIGIDRSLFPVDESVIAQSTFRWHFGDGTTADTLTTSHTYTKPGTYIVLLKVKDPNYSEEIELESLQINILPSKDYSLPKAVIKVNGKKVNDPLIDLVSIKKGASVELDARESSGKIKSFKWDMGDGSKLIEGNQVNHVFNFQEPYNYSIFPLLRVEDENGLISDNFVQLSNEETNVASDSSDNNEGNNSLLNWAILTAGVLAFVSVAYYFYRNLKK